MCFTLPTKTIKTDTNIEVKLKLLWLNNAIDVISLKKLIRDVLKLINFMTFDLAMVELANKLSNKHEQIHFEQIDIFR